MKCFKKKIAELERTIWKNNLIFHGIEEENKRKNQKKNTTYN